MYINTYKWDLEKWYRCTYFQGRNGDAGVEKGPVDAVGEGEDGTNWESGTDIQACSHVKDIAGESLYAQGVCCLLLCDDLEEWDQGEEGGVRGRG